MRRIAYLDDCRRQCPGGNPCCCSRLVPHALHICSDPDCKCHTRRRYATEPQVIKVDEPVCEEVTP